MTRPAPHRAPRTALVAAALTVVTLAAHTAGGGSVDALSAAVVLALAIALAAGVSNRRLGLARLIPALLGAQVVLHLLMTVTGAHGPAHGTGSGWLMVVAHGLAAIAIAMVVVHADDLLMAWSRLVRTALGTAVRVPTTPEAHGVAPTGSAPPLGTLTCLLHRVERRGPPLAWHLQPS